MKKKRKVQGKKNLKNHASNQPEDGIG